MTTTPRTAVSKSEHPMRRSERLHLEVAVLITSLNPRKSYCEEGTTATVNAHGCGVVVADPLECGTRVLLDLILAGRSRPARVVDTVSLGDGSGWLVGLEFDEPSNVWQVDPAPPGWPPSR